MPPASSAGATRRDVPREKRRGSHHRHSFQTHPRSRSPTPIPHRQTTTTTPIFGSAATFGTGTGGFGGFTGSAPAASSDAKKEDDDDGDAPADEEECAAEFAPVVQLDEVEVKSGEEDEEVLVDIKCKLYRFVQETNEWKERGVGQSRVLQHKDHKRCRYLMREEKTLKIRANHIVMPGTQIQEHAGNEKAVVFNCVDFSDEEMKPELFCIRFASAERAQQFKKAYEDAAATNEPLLGKTAGGDDGDKKEAAEEEKKEDEADKVADEIAAKATVKDDDDDDE